MKKTLISFSILTLLSCTNSVDFNLKNASLNKIDSMVVTNNFDSITINELKVNSEISKELSFLKKQPKNDGNYKVTIFKNGTSKDTTFGYFSNGMPLNKRFNIEISERGFVINEK